MADKSPPNRIAFLRLGRKWTQQELAERVEAHWVTISKLERGQMKLTLEWIQRLATAFSVEPGDLLVNREASFPITGFVSGAGIVDQRKDLAADEHLEWSVEINKYFRLRNSSWYYARDALFPPVVRAHDLLRFTNFSQSDDRLFLDRICLLPFTESRIPLIGVLHRGSNNGSYDLDMPDGTVRRDVAHAADMLMVLTMVISRLEQPVEQHAPDDFE